MPSELLHFPPSYTLVGLYRLITDPLIRNPVLDKVKHATLRGVIVSGIYAIGSWSTLDWFIRKFLISGGGSWFGFGKGRVGEALKESATGRGNVWVGFGSVGMEVDLILCKSILLAVSIELNATIDTHLLILLPQISSILRFFIYKNLKLARSRAYALTVASRGKPSEFWSQVSLGVFAARQNTEMVYRDILRNGKNHLNLARVIIQVKKAEGMLRRRGSAGSYGGPYNWSLGIVSIIFPMSDAIPLANVMCFGLPIPIYLHYDTSLSHHRHLHSPLTFPSPIHTSDNRLTPINHHRGVSSPALFPH
jgi:hypothetical protein